MTYNPNAIQATYDSIAEREDTFEKGFSLRNDIPREFIKRYLQPTDVVLDAGGGSGINAIMMAQRGAQVTLLDLSSRMLACAAGNIQLAGLTGKINLTQGDITDLSQFQDGQFNFVVCLGGALSYVCDQATQAVDELVRVARQGAVLIIGCDSKFGLVRWLLSSDSIKNLEDAIEIYETSQYEAGEGAYARLYTPAELTALLEAANCEILEIASTPTLINGWDQSDYPLEKQEKLKALELRACTVPELLGAGHHLFCVARKR